jgi:hypothetical protein
VNEDATRYTKGVQRRQTCTPLAFFIAAAPSNQRANARYFRLSGTTPPDSISFAMTCLCSQTFISAEPSRGPV